MSEFQKQIYEQLDKLDDFLGPKNQSERMVYGLIVGVLFAAIVYFAFFDLSSNYKAEKEYAYNDILGKVQAERDYIESMENGGFLALEQQIRSARSSVEQANANLQTLEGYRDEIFTYSKDWFLTFDEASKTAINMGLTVNGTDIKMSDKPTLGGMKHSSFVLFGYGRFTAILRYIDWLERYGKFLAVDSIIVESKDNRLNFSVSIRNFRGEA